jgi:competence protein ComEC
MATLRVTLIDVGWGDSIFIEATTGASRPRYALVDSNDTETLRCSYIFLKRHFEKAELDIGAEKPIFDFVLLSHAHADHAQGLKALMREFGTENFWYPKSLQWASHASLIRYANRSSNVQRHQAIDQTYVMPRLGDVELEVLWPRRDDMQPDENNNSIVLRLQLDDVSFLLTGDAEKEVWADVAERIPSDTRFFKVPHHGSKNGTLDDDGLPVWLNECPSEAKLGISAHIRPFRHPDEEVIALLRDRKPYRTDQHYHVTFETDGQHVWTQYSHDDRPPTP